MSHSSLRLRSRTLASVIAGALLIGASEVASTSCGQVVEGDVALCPFGYSIDGGRSLLWDFSELLFLTDDLLLVVINQRDPNEIPNGMVRTADSPLSKVLIIDPNSKRVLRSGDIAVEKTWHAVCRVSGGRFAVADEQGLTVCDSYLRCGGRAKGKPYITSSPDGRLIALRDEQVGGWSILDSSSFARIAAFPYNEVNQVVLGERTALLSGPSDWSIWHEDGTVTAAQIDPKVFWLSAKFIDSQTLIAAVGVPQEPYHASFVTFDGKSRVLSKIVSPSAQFFLSDGHSVAGVSETGYTRMNSILNILDIENTRPINLQQVKIFDVQTGKTLADYEWNPSPHPALPALSPNGRQMAVISVGGYLRIRNVGGK